VLFIECRAPLETLRERARAREGAPERGSDATWEVVRTQAGAFEPLDDVPPADRHSLRTDRPLEATVDEAERLVAAAVGF
jgi:predicted kinase